jgi:uncharacterized protein YndB with AHSA1/START domain
MNETITTTSIDPETQLGEATFTRIYDASPALMFECMTTPEHLQHFWGPVGVSTPLANITVDLTVGGVFETIMVNDETGDEYPTKGIFVEIDPPTRLAFAEGDGDGAMTTTITFNDLGDGRTEVVSHQMNVPAMFLSPEAQAGMTSSFDKFEQYLATLQS